MIESIEIISYSKYRYMNFGHDWKPRGLERELPIIRGQTTLNDIPYMTLTPASPCLLNRRTNRDTVMSAAVDPTFPTSAVPVFKGSHACASAPLKLLQVGPITYHKCIYCLVLSTLRLASARKVLTTQQMSVYMRTR